MKLNFGKSAIISVIAAGSLLAIIVILFLFTGTTVIVDMSGYPPLRASNVYVGDNEALVRSEKTNKYTITGLRGSHDVTINRAGYGEFKQRVSTFWKNTIVIKPSLEEVPAAKLATELDAGYDKSKSSVLQADYFEDKTWLAYKLKLESVEQLAVVVARYDNVAGKWVVLNYLNEGEFEINSDKYTVPAALIKEYLK
jgi:hypothetical protein